MYKLYFELTRFDDAGKVVHSDSYLISLDERGLFFKVIVNPLRAFLKKHSPNFISEEFKL